MMHNIVLPILSIYEQNPLHADFSKLLLSYTMFLIIDTDKSNTFSAFFQLFNLYTQSCNKHLIYIYMNLSGVDI